MATFRFMSRSPSLLLGAALLLGTPTAADAAVLPASGGTAGAGADTPFTGFDAQVLTPDPGPVGDVNGDGRADVLAGRVPAAKVVFGSTSRAAVDGASAAARTWTVTAAPWADANGYTSGVELRPAGDLDGDGRADVLATPRDGYGPTDRPAGSELGAIVAGPTAAGTTAITRTGGASVRFVSSEPNVTGITGAAALGDVDGDGFADLGIESGASGYSGRATVIYGGPGLAGTVDLAAPGSNGFVIAPATNGYVELQAPGDVNGDGLADVGVGATARGSAGERPYAYFAFGSRTRAGTLSLANWQARAARIGPTASSDAIVPIGDTDGDGFDDVVLHTKAKESTLIRGRANLPTMGVSSTFPKIDWQLRATGAPADVNGDGRPDAVVTAIDPAYGATPIPGLVLLGSPANASVSIPRTGTPTALGIRFGSRITSLGDVDGDGHADLGVPTGVVYGYGPGAEPPKDTTPPKLSLGPTATPAGYGTCMWGERYQVMSRIWVTIDEPATLEFTAVQGSTTRRATLGVNASTAAKVAAPKSLFGRSTASVTLTVIPVDAAGNRGAAATITHQVRNLGYDWPCLGDGSELS